ncbi:hypothetical protein M758_6G044600 [Ceratodon purpureus]|nr:hypothetical protein M758_6G044600 [Ceratodon purpureus]
MMWIFTFCGILGGLEFSRHWYCVFRIRNCCEVCRLSGD